MNGIEFINPSESKFDSEDLPWLKDWVKTTREYELDHEVFTIYPGDKGLLLMTGSFKCFVFRKDSVHNYLVEALEHWVSTKTQYSPLVIVSNVKGRPSYGLNHDKPKVYWQESDSCYTSIRPDQPIKFPKHGVNPFLSTQPPDPNSPTRNGAKKPAEKSK